jgi:ubiquinone/menaquinone biosynthesis C-methylase UbiE
LDYLEFLGKHPWQLHPDMQERLKGLDRETVLSGATSFYVPSEKAAISDEQISQAWDKLADKWSSSYMEYGDFNRQYIIDPAIFRLIGTVKGLSILDAGCGGGYLCRLLAKKGAKMIGVDISKRFIEIAKQKDKEAPLGIAYYPGTLSNLSIFKNEAFDMVISNLALMDVLDLKKAITELFRVLKEKGKLIFSIMHPCFSSPPVHGWVRIPQDSQRKEDWIYWKVDRYFDRSMEIWQYRDWPSTFSFHRPLSDYIKMLMESGFTITDFEEPIPSKRAMEEHYREFGNECDRIPWFLIIGAKKT